MLEAKVNFKLKKWNICDKTPQFVKEWLTEESGCIWPNAQSDKVPQSWSVTII